VDDHPWPLIFSDMVQRPVFSPNGRRVAAVVRDDERWSIAVDGKAWPGTFDMVWDPVFSPDGRRVIAKVERARKLSLAMDGLVWSEGWDQLWDPVFSPQGDKVLVRGTRAGSYYRQVLDVSSVFNSVGG
jgi:hypothetical protein